MESQCRQTKRRPSVCVLLSAYNGEAFIGEQIESILGQSYPKIRLIVRDDGSKDGTLKLLEKYESEGKLTLIRGENRGFIGSFFELLARAPKASYYAWCDQDDVWEKDKIRRAVYCLEKRKAALHEQEAEKPRMVFCSCVFVDEGLHFVKKGLVHQRGPSFRNSLMDCIPLGFCTVFSGEARDLMLKNPPVHSCGHDWWTYMVCAAFGEVLYDRDYTGVKYRRLSDSVSPGGRGFLSMQLYRIKKLFFNDYFSKIRAQIREFSKIYAPLKKEGDQKLLTLFTEPISIRSQLQKVFWPGFFRQTLTDEILLRIIFLLGRL